MKFFRSEGQDNIKRNEKPFIMIYSAEEYSIERILK